MIAQFLRAYGVFYLYSGFGGGGETNGVVYSKSVGTKLICLIKNSTEVEEIIEGLTDRQTGYTFASEDVSAVLLIAVLAKKPSG